MYQVNSSCNPSNFPQPNTTFIRSAVWIHRATDSANESVLLQMFKYDLFLSSCNTLISDFESASWGAAACLNKTMGSTKTNESDACR